MRSKTPPLRMPDLDGVRNYATRYRDIYWDGTLEMFAFVKKGLITMTHKNLYALVRAHSLPEKRVCNSQLSCLHSGPNDVLPRN